MSKSFKITAGLILFTISCSIGIYLFLNRETLDLIYQIYWLIGAILSLSAFFVVVFLVKTEKNPDPEEVQKREDAPISDFKIKKIDGKKMVVRKNPDRYEYKEESNPALIVLRWVFIVLFVIMVFSVWYFSGLN